MQEIWKDIVNYEGKYQISNTGKVKSMNYNNTNIIKELKPKINKQGFLEIKLSIHNKTKDFMLNRLVIEHFTNKKISKNDIVMYKDGNKENNNLDNLYLITRGQRQEFTYDNGKRKRYIFEYNGKMLAIKDIAKINNISEELIRRRLSLGWNIYECAELPKGEYYDKKL